MKKLMKNSCIVICMSLAFVINVFGLSKDPPPVPTLGAISASTLTNPDPSYNPDECTFTMKFRVVLSNLGTLPPFPSNGFETIPLDYPKMYLEYSVNSGPTLYVPVNQFTDVGESNSIPIYEQVIESYAIDINDTCIGSNFFMMPYATRLVTLSEEEEYIDYPMEDYTSPCDINSCIVNNSWICPENNDTPTSSCLPNGQSGTGTESTPEYAPVFPQGLLKVYCYGCTNTAPGGGGGGTENDNKEDEVIENLFDVSVSPNPFTDNAEVRWSGKEAIEDIFLFDTFGKLIRTWGTTEVTSNNRLRINTAALPKGIYFIKINSTEQSKILKIIRQ